MNRYLKQLKDAINKLDGTNPKKEYRLLEQMDDKMLLLEYKWELEKMDFSLDEEGKGFRHIVSYIRNYVENEFGDRIFADTDKYRLMQMWSSDKDKDECLEIFLLRTPRQQFKIGICAYRKGFESAIYYANMYGKKKLLEFHKPSKRGDVLSSIVSKLPGFRKAEENYYLLTLSAVSSMAEFKKTIFPKFKSAYEAMHELSKNW
ncbi:MAG: hypothetical protein PUC15_05305 [Lentisphaeria bacterium]|nr:hypothetical protein [Lentisphaeria bacterium]